MSEYIPFELQEQIIKRLPVISLIQFRSVSKAWKSLIDSSRFIAAHSVRQTQPPPRLLVRYKDSAERKINYVTFVDDETFPQQRFVPTLPLHIDLLRFSTSVGSSHGLLCFYGYYLVPVSDSSSTVFIHKKEMNFVVWNPSIRKSIAVPVPDELSREGYKPIFGFGVSPITCDPKIVVISCFHKWLPELDKPLKVEVYTLSSRKWTSLSTNHLPHSSVDVTCDQVATDRFIYWLACDHKVYHLIVSFDMITEEMGLVNLPPTLVREPDMNMNMLTIDKVQDTLAVLEYGIKNEQPVCVVWKMEDGIQKSFTKLFTINLPKAWIPRVLGFRNNGDPIMETKPDDTEPINIYTTISFIVYEPYSERVTDVGIIGTYGSLVVNSYTETLLLLNL